MSDIPNEDFSHRVINYRWWFIATTILIFLVTASGARYLTINNDTRVFFSEGNPQFKALEALENTYTKDQSVVFVIAPKNGNVFTRETLSAIEELTESSWQIPYSSRVDSVTNFQHAYAVNDDLIVANLVENADQLRDDELTRARSAALAEPQLVNRLLSSSGHVTSVFINCLYPGESLDEVSQITAFSRNLAEEFRSKYPDLDIYLFGSIIMDNAFGEIGLDDMMTLIPFMYLTLIVIIGLCLRSVIAVFATFLIILMSMMTGMGLAGWLGISLNAASIAAPTIIMTLAVADSVHIQASAYQLMREGQSKHEAIAESLRINLQPVFLTSITTAIGFLSMNFSDAPPFRDLGNIVSMGVMAAFVYSALLLPSLLSVLPLRAKKSERAVNVPCCNRLACFIIRRRKAVFWSSLLGITLLSVGTLRIELNDSFLYYLGERYQVRQAGDFYQHNLSGADVIEYSLNAGESGGINNPDYLATVEAFANWYREQPKVVQVSTITDTVKRLNKNMHGDDETYYRIPESRELAAQYLLLYELSLPFGLDLNNQINVDKSATRMSVIIRDTTTREIREQDERARQWLKQHAPPGMFTYGSGLSVIWAHLSERNIYNMLGASFGALMLISLLLIFVLKSVRLGLVSLLPNLVPALMAFGLWGMTIGQVGLGLSVVVAMTLGIVVDDTVHFISKYLRAHREHGMNPAQGIQYAFHTVGTAMWVTTVALVAGFMVLTLSGFRMNSDMGLLSAVTILLALVMDFLFLPTLLMITGKHRKQGEQPCEKCE
ncbi:MMPL family transporter [Photobacterium sp. SDRW27]|uniref:efflux RND transporter permease subunit n=1 Tax=Photobacterium obscurum TaxID=2829490 RepID=UPI0022442D15|nr:MMPL family transporter [Photobacterium obscurum]MCW8328711.1 MMPL family transporter [Photobacterium obscurum]